MGKPEHRCRLSECETGPFTLTVELIQLCRSECLHQWGCYWHSCWVQWRWAEGEGEVLYNDENRAFAAAQEQRGEFSYSVPISALDSSHFYWLDFVLFIFTSAEIQFLPDKIMGIPA